MPLQNRGMSNEEVVAVLGHELGHWALSHTLVNMIIAELNMLLMLSVFAYFYRWKLLYEAFGFHTTPTLVGLILVFHYIMALYNQYYDDPSEDNLGEIEEREKNKTYHLWMRQIERDVLKAVSSREPPFTEGRQLDVQFIFHGVDHVYIEEREQVMGVMGRYCLEPAYIITCPRYTVRVGCSLGNFPFPSFDIFCLCFKVIFTFADLSNYPNDIHYCSFVLANSVGIHQITLSSGRRYGYNRDFTQSVLQMNVNNNNHNHNRRRINNRGQRVMFPRESLRRRRSSSVHTAIEYSEAEAVSRRYMTASINNRLCRLSINQSTDSLINPIFPDDNMATLRHGEQASLLAAANQQLKMIVDGVENGVVGRPDVQCGIDNIVVSINTEKPLKGRIYVQGEAENPQCMRSATNGPFDHPQFDLPIGTCNMRRQRTLHPRGVVFSFTLVVSFHPIVEQFTT
uniref:ZP domain-containing protein n=1 Tax=Heterorhabditis bacteriophora TaxID=37862 RepID=A0A1I7XF82_HETBA